MPADAADKLAELVQQAGRLSSLPDYSRDEKERDLFGEIRLGLLGESALCSPFEQSDMVAMLQLMVTVGQSKKRFAARATENLKVFLGSRPWLKVAHRTPELLSQLREFMAGDEVTLSLLQDKPVDSGKGGAGIPVKAPEDLEELAREAEELIRKPLLEGRDVMRENGWECHGTDDKASAGFSKFSRAVTRLAESAMGKEAVATPGSALPVLAGLEENWGDIMRFLVSLHTERRILRSQVEACVKNLRALSSDFAEVEKATESLPWAEQPAVARLASMEAPDAPPGVPPPDSLPLAAPEDPLPPAAAPEESHAPHASRESLGLPPPAPPVSSAAVPVRTILPTGTTVLDSAGLGPEGLVCVLEPAKGSYGYGKSASPALAPEPALPAASPAVLAKASAPPAASIVIAPGPIVPASSPAVPAKDLAPPAASIVLAPEPSMPAASSAVPAKALAHPELAEPAKPGIVWVDLNCKAWQTSSLSSREDVEFQGFDGSDERKPSPWLTYVLQHSDKPSRVAVMIVNRRHKREVMEIRQHCAAKGLEPPQVIVCCRKGTEEEAMKEWSIADMQAVSDWDVASKKALEYITSKGVAAERRGVLGRLAGYLDM